MKLSASKILVAILFVTSAFAGAYFDYFHVRSEGDDAVIEWRTSQENNIKNFVVERRGPRSAYSEVQTFQPKGDNSIYTFRDQSVYKQNDYIFIYRVKIVDNNGLSTYSNEASVSLSISGIKRTWGSIKAMFR